MSEAFTLICLVAGPPIVKKSLLAVLGLGGNWIFWLLNTNTLDLMDCSNSLNTSLLAPVALLDTENVF